MATTLFKDTTYTVAGLVDNISRGEIALPDIQRPFVWPASKVRDLLDSMYKGFPVGYLLFWETGADGGAKQIGTDSKEKAARLLIVDGQQRLTSLYAVITGSTIVKADYSEGRIRIAFRPSDSTFAVADATVERDPEFISDVSQLWVPGEKKKVVRAFLAGLEAKRPLSEKEKDDLEDAIDRVHDLNHYPFKAVELGASVDEEQVAEVFVRINSEGVTLNQADFILTLMSVFWDQGRRDLENFARDCKQPALSKASPFNWYIQPSPAQLLRVSVGLAFRRAVLKHVYSLLRGKDVETGKSDPTKREEQFAILKEAHESVIDLTNWHEYLQCLERAGYRGSKMISSDNTLLFTYALWLIGRLEFKVPLDKLRESIASWFFMAHMTGRYSGAFESQFEQDMSRLSDLKTGDSNAFIATLARVVGDTLPNDFWSITLPNELATSASKSPALLAYIAALNILDADALLSTGKVRSRLDPAITAQKGIERHHLFPKAYLRTLGISDNREVNQIANMALVEWSDNIEISDLPPAVYWPQQLEKKALSGEILERQVHLHALPNGWEKMPYEQFLPLRRRLMAAVVREAFEKIQDTSYVPTYPPVAPVSSGEANSGPKMSVSDLFSLGVLRPEQELVGKGQSGEVSALLLADGKVEFNGQIYSSLSQAAKNAKGVDRINGWRFWHTQTSAGLQSLKEIRASVWPEEESEANLAEDFDE